VYSLRLTCSPEQVDDLSAELWAAGTAGVEEIELCDRVLLIAAFEQRDDSLLRFFQAQWQAEPEVDWIGQTHRAWPPRAIGNRLFLAPPWSADPTPPGRIRMIHNPGLASGTGEHPCTQLALAALENCTQPGSVVADIGTGSGVLSIAALRLGAARAISVDTDEAALHVARENFSLNALAPRLVTGSADCLADQVADMTVANISGTVLFSLLNDLLRITRRVLILTGFPESELRAFQFRDASTSAMGDWRCITVPLV
jgi:ribosomal protein L11 methyltransferase